MTSLPFNPSRQYWLRAHTHPSSPIPSKYHNLYLRLHGSGTSSVLLTPEPPIHLKAHFEPSQGGHDGQQGEEGKSRKGEGRFREGGSGAQIFLAGKHPTRFWGLKLSTDKRDTKCIAAWERVEIVENSRDEGWSFEGVELDTEETQEKEGQDEKKVVVEQLVWDGEEIRAGDGDGKEEDGEKYQWKGWIVGTGAYAGLKPQLFWLTNVFGQRGEEELPEGFEKVIVVREWLDEK